METPNGTSVLKPNLNQYFGPSNEGELPEWGKFLADKIKRKQLL